MHGMRRKKGKARNMGVHAEKRRSGLWTLKNAGRVLVVFLAIYCVLYVRQFRKINREFSYEYMVAADLPVECRSWLEMYDEENASTLGAWVVRCDMDDDGLEELISDPGDYARGAANSWYRIWKKLPSGKYVSMGEYYCDMCLFIPGIGIYGKPAIWCIESTGNMEWVEWKDGRYSGKGLIP